MDERETVRKNAERYQDQRAIYLNDDDFRAATELAQASADETNAIRTALVDIQHIAEDFLDVETHSLHRIMHVLNRAKVRAFLDETSEGVTAPESKKPYGCIAPAACGVDYRGSVARCSTAGCPHHF